MKSKKIQNTVGIAAIVLLAALVGVVFFGNKEPEKEEQTNKSAGSITFEENELVYDGTGMLELMDGVVAKDSNGNDVAHKVEAIITGDGTLNRKLIRYSFTDTDRKTVTAKRTLVMKNYEGPSLSVESGFFVNAEELKDLINVLKDKELLNADDGYGRDITSSVKCLREKKENGQYSIKFSIVNAYEDSEEVSVVAYIDGDVPDPEIRLSTKEVTLRRTEYFDAKKYIVYSSDGYSENVTEKIQIDSSVDVTQAGDYRVVYRLYSADKTAVTTTVLRVRVDL